ncbi:kinase-like domain-containing protein [Ampelomyces quisqualis]|uniref:non-specific serine/threonine protein kinase n=1 Tax=Ampelomyces quisqualis TaxID=50730 RepID=A0A6A5QR54_AMPQU|nr:kinase-like domain-containing protein [Ampelomyces quisqualis]
MGNAYFAWDFGSRPLRPFSQPSTGLHNCFCCCLIVRAHPPFCLNNPPSAAARAVDPFRATFAMTSPPATPPVEPPHDSELWRFEETGATCEWAEEYCPGGFHPVNLGDTFHGGKYKAIRKLGDGSYSTVWLAVSKGTPRYVALKIMIAKAASSATELLILEKLSKLAPMDPNSQHITVLLDEFQHEGPNGKHQCLVFEVMGATAASLVEELPENKPKMYGKVERYPKWLSKKILLHSLRGLSFLHSNGIVHGDMQPGNMLFSAQDICTVDEDELAQDEETTAIPLQRLDGKTDRWAPKNLYLQQSLHDRVKLTPQLLVKLSDLGSAFWQTQPPTSTVTPVALRAPELILRQPFGPAIDIWSFGCLMFEFLTGRTLFALMMLSHDEKEQNDTDDDHLIQLNDILGPLPDSMMRAWPRARKWYTQDRHRLQPYSNDPPYIHDALDKLFADHKSPEISDEESAVVLALIRQILDFDPQKRPSAHALLKHPWFSS